ncbi:MAG: hypothetical protein ACHQ49_01995 [Elusimicrobiota bacterium]
MTKTQVQITLTRAQLDDLLNVVCLGEWMINAARIYRIKKFNTLAQQIYKAAGEAKLKGVEFHEDDKSYWLTQEYEESILREFKDEYDNESFWDGLPDRLAHRDLERKLGRKAIEAMGNKERFLAHQTICRKYEEEFEKHGIDRVVVPELAENKNRSQE